MRDFVNSGERIVKDYSIITEVPGVGASREQLLRLQQRYQVAAGFCSQKKVLEVACGAGNGLGYLAKNASLVVGGDYTDSLVRIARNHYRGRLDVVQLDGHALPFGDASFDTIILFEALYYFQDPNQFVQECRRILARDGTLVICSVNNEWPEFNPSPHNTVYYSGPELCSLLNANGFQTELFGAFSTASNSLLGKAVSLLKRIAVTLHLIPRSMKGKELLKRIFFGRLVSLPAELGVPVEEIPQITPILASDPTAEYKVLYAIGHLPGCGNME